MAQNVATNSRYPEQEWRRRVDLAACYRLADMFGFSDVIWNHITAKVPGTAHFLINRFGLRYDEVTASNLVSVDLDGNVVDAGSAQAGDDVNVTGFVIHSAIHAARPDIHCVMHAHSSAGMAVAALKEGLVPLGIDGMAFHNRVAYHDFEGMSVDTGERERLAANLGDRKVMILRNHGLLTCGETVGEAFMKMYYLERACSLQMQVLATGREIEQPSPEICERTARQSLEFAHGKYEWPALLRLLDQKAPDYCN
ncbi:MAG: class II aldolase/adducin family protein [Acidiferrobacterales bacterium]|nr:class II aldolase/adducin family protein [Acidiferrobacterales bacterium]